MSDTLVLSPELINAYRTLMTEPEKHGIPMKPLAECFIETEEVTPRHILWEQWEKFTGRDIPKVIFYIIMDKQYAERLGKAASGHEGYKLQIAKAA